MAGIQTRVRRDDLKARGLCVRDCGRPRRNGAYCRECNADAARKWRQGNRERHNEYMRMRGSPTPEVYAAREAEYRAKYPVGVRKRRFEFQPHAVNERRAYGLLKSYGLTVTEYDAMLESQGGGCAICGAEQSGDPRRPNLQVDHDHLTGATRGLLCMQCNNALGIMGDSPDRLRAAAAYLERSR